MESPSSDASVDSDVQIIGASPPPGFFASVHARKGAVGTGATLFSGNGSAAGADATLSCSASVGDDSSTAGDGDDADATLPCPASAGNGGSSATPSWPAAAGLRSSYRSQGHLDAVCKKYGVPKEFAALPAGGRCACSAPPPGAICVYADALKAGMRVPLHAFFSDVLTHFGVAPSQLTPNGWRYLAGFVVLSHFAGLPPSMAVFRRFFSLAKCTLRGWYCFQPRDNARKLFTGNPSSIRGWKQGFFFLSSPAPWPCPVDWGEPSDTPNAEVVLTGKDKETVTKLLRERERGRGDAPIDLGAYLCDSNLAAARIISRGGDLAGKKRKLDSEDRAEEGTTQKPPQDAGQDQDDGDGDAAGVEELKEKLRVRGHEVAALREELKKARAELAGAKQAAAQEKLRSGERAREAYRKGEEDTLRAVVRDLDALRRKEAPRR